MFIQVQKLIIIIVIVFSLTKAVDPSRSAAGITIGSPRVTDAGTWGSWAYCSNGSYVSSFRLKTVKDQGFLRDDTALNGIKLFCVLLGGRKTLQEIQSKVGALGDWGNLFQCDGLLTGFQIRSQKNRKIQDDTAANNIRFVCSDLKHSILEGDGLSNGEWTQSQQCPTRHAICGMQTQVQDNEGLDNTGLNNVNFQCCEIPNPGETCKAQDSYELLYSCDNLDGKFPLECSVSQQVGIGGSNSDTSSGTTEGKIMTDIGFKTGSTIGALKANFQSNLGTSEITGHNWQHQNTNTWMETTTKSFSFSVPPGVKSDVFQIVGRCGSFSAKTSVVKKVDTLKNMKLQMTQIPMINYE